VEKMTEADPVVKRELLTTVEMKTLVEDISLMVTLSAEVKGCTLVLQVKTKTNPLLMLRMENEGLVMMLPTILVVTEVVQKPLFPEGSVPVTLAVTGATESWRVKTLLSRARRGTRPQLSVTEARREEGETSTAKGETLRVTVKVGRHMRTGALVSGAQEQASPLPSLSESI